MNSNDVLLNFIVNDSQLKKGKAALRSLGDETKAVEKKFPGVGKVIQSSMEKPLRSLGVVLGQNAAIVNNKVVSAYSKLGKVEGTFLKIRSSVLTANKALLTQDTILQQHINRQKVIGQGRFRDTQGRFVSRYTETPYFTEVRASSVKGASKSQTEELFGKPVKSVMADFDVGKLAARAALTIPIWLGLRTAIMGTMDIIPQAINRFKELDEATARMRILTDGAEQFEGFTERAMQTLNKLSRSTGQSVQELQEIYTAVSSTGIDADTSFIALDVISKGALATGADAKELAGTMAGLINTMGHTMDVGSNKGEKFVALMAMLHSTMKTNAGEMNDIAQALGQAGASAAVAGMKMHELVANVGVLQTAMARAGLGGTALRTSLDQVVQKRDIVENFLNRPLSSDEITNQFTLVRSIVEKMGNLVSSGDTESLGKVQSIMQEIFGVKAGRNINILRNNTEKWAQSIGDLNRLLAIGQTQGVDAMAAAFMKDSDVIIATLTQQQKRFGEIWKENQSSLVSGIFGFSGEGWTDAFKSLNDVLEKSTGFFKGFGIVIKTLGISALVMSLGLLAKGFVAVGGALTALMLNPGWLMLGKIALLVGAAVAVHAIYKKIKEDSAKDSEKKLSNLKSAGSKGYEFYSGLYENNRNVVQKLQKEWESSNSSVDFNTFVSSKYKGTKEYSAWARGYIDRYKKKNLTTGGTSPGDPNTETMGLSTEERDRLYKGQADQLQLLTSYGIDNLQIKRQELSLLKDIYIGEQLTTKQAEKRLEIAKEEVAIRQKWSQEIKTGIKDSLLGNLQGKGNNLFADMSKNFTNQLQNNMAESLSNVIMSTGISDVMSGAFDFLGEGSRRITDPILKAHSEGGQKIHDFIVSAFDKVTGKQTASTGAGMGTAGYSGSGNGLPGIWGSSAFTTKGTTYESGPAMTSQGTMVPSSKTPVGAGRPNFWGKMGARASAVSGSAIIAAGGVQQMSGGGAKNIVGGAGQVAMGVGMGVASLGAAAGGLAFLGPLGLAIGAVLIIASMFMKGAKSTQTSTQTSETKVGSKIDISNKRLELINRNLIALKNTMEVFALSSSAYFSEKNGNIDSQFALSSRRSMA
jgi:TP901 family phage tail tape measure protein